MEHARVYSYLLRLRLLRQSVPPVGQFQYPRTRWGSRQSGSGHTPLPALQPVLHRLRRCRQHGHVGTPGDQQRCGDLMGKGNRTFFKLGDYNAICRVCGFKRKASEMRLRWDGVYVCEQDWEIRQPQDFVRGLPEEVAPEWTQPEPPPVFLPLGKLGTGAGPAI